jgi:BioD-like phosphotransacetylase family protein
MATALYITSTETYSGKTALCVGLAHRMRRDGLHVGYIKPLSFSATRDEKGAVDEDSRVIKRLLGLKEPLDVLCPVLITPSLLDRIIAGEKLDLTDRIMTAYNAIAADKDVVIVEGANNMATGCLIDMSGIEITAAFKAKSVVVVRYRYDLVIDHLLIAKRVVGEAVVGAVVNTVPAGRMEWVAKQVKPFCEKRGIKIFAVLPEDRLLMSTTVQEIADALGGEVLCAKNRTDNLVENVLVGAMGVESALQYFRRKANKAVITGSDRGDLILAALETSTSCLVLSGHTHPDAMVVGRAEEQGVPIIMSHSDTMTTIERVERCFGKVRFHDPKKMLRFDQMLDERFDYAGLYAALGLKAKGS